MVLNLSPLALAAHLNESLTSLQFVKVRTIFIIMSCDSYLALLNTTIGTAKKQTRI